MIERRDDLRLTLETFPPLRVSRESFGQDFDRNLALQLAVASAIDLTLYSRRYGSFGSRTGRRANWVGLA